MIGEIYKKFIFKNPRKIILFIVILISFLGYYSKKLEIDASSETLLLKHDKDLAFQREVEKDYKTQNILIVAFSPKDDLLSKKSLKTIKSISDDILKLKETKSITSILNVPLLQSPIRPIKELINNIKTLQNSKNINKDLVKKEFLTSPLYKNSLVSKDFKTTAIVINLQKENKILQLIKKRNKILQKKNSGVITQNEISTLKKIGSKLIEYRDKQRQLDSIYIHNIRNILKNYKQEGALFLGGVNMISTDILSFIKSDLIIYGSTLIILIIIILWIIFREIKWVLLSIFICVASITATTGILGFFNWEVTVVSSNFISLQLIITISIIIHLIIRYKELNIKYKNSSQYKLVLNTMLSKLKPSFFAIITTIAGFGSLLLSNIEPIINFGWMMSIGVLISLLISFLIFPAILILLKKSIPPKTTFKNKFYFISLFITFVKRKNNSILIGTLFLIVFSITGASKLMVENSFINYFKKDTNIYKSMRIIDQKLGGTTPLDIIIDFNGKKINENNKKIIDNNDLLSSFEDEFNDVGNNSQYWFTPMKMNTITKIHNYLNSIDSVGKVRSLSTMLRLGKILNHGEDLDSFELALLYKKLPKEYKDILFTPYINIDKNQARISLRIIDSTKDLRRDDLLKKIKKDLTKIIDNDNIKIRLSNLMVLYNNMLQSLFNSQIKTLGFVAIILFIMFLILFRSFIVALIAILINLIPMSIVFGIMGWLKIPLDIMTITIAAISIGIGVDDTIHYIYKFKREFKKDHNYEHAMQRSHKTVGFAMIYTSISIIVGFCILVLSNLMPTIYFGILTVIVMVTMLLSSLILLPKLLILFKPFSKT